MEINVGDRMVLNTIGKAGFENTDNWANRGGIKPDDRLIVAYRLPRSLDFQGCRFTHPACKFALVHNGEQQ